MVECIEDKTSDGRFYLIGNWFQYGFDFWGWNFTERGRSRHERGVAPEENVCNDGYGERAVGLCMRVEASIPVDKTSESLPWPAFLLTSEAA